MQSIQVMSHLSQHYLRIIWKIALRGVAIKSPAVAARFQRKTK
jgi:hypothetical protein